MPERRLWVYWEQPPGVMILPPHIALCRRVMHEMAKGYALTVVTPENVKKYLPELPDRVFKIALAPRGRIEKYFGRSRRKAGAIAQRADYIRAFLLERYGGLYIDSDAIILRDLGPYFDELERVGFLVTRRRTGGKSHVSVGFYGSVANGAVIEEYSDALRRRLAGPLDYEWNEVGAAMLTPIVDRRLDEVSIVDEAEVQPVTFEKADEMFSSLSLDPAEVISDNARIFMLYSGPFKASLAGAGVSELYSSDRLVSKVFRRALGDLDPATVSVRPDG